MLVSLRAAIAAFAVLLGCATAMAAAPGPEFIQDDYAAAQAQARQRKVPVVVEVWAPW